MRWLVNGEVNKKKSLVYLFRSNASLKLLLMSDCYEEIKHHLETKVAWPVVSLKDIVDRC